MTTPHLDKWRVVFACLALRVVDGLGSALPATPLLQLIELNVCRSFYGNLRTGDLVDDGAIPEKCKAAGVQSDISYINGTNSILTLVPSLLAAFLYFGITKYVDKKNILLANTVGNLLTHLYLMLVVYNHQIFDIRWMWLSGISAFIGGGDLIFSAILQAILADVVPNSKLSTIYLYSTAGALTAIVVGSTSSLVIMESSVWTPIVMAAATKALNVLIVLVLIDKTDSKPAGFSRLPTEADDLIIEAEVNEPATEAEVVDLATEAEVNDLAIEAEINDMSTEASDDLNDLPSLSLKTWWQISPALKTTLISIAFPLIICSLQEGSNGFRGILPYWLSREYQWSLRAVGFVLLSEKLLTALIISLLPRIPHRLLAGNWNGRSERINPNLGLSRLCLGFTCVGAALLSWRSGRVSAVLSMSVLAAGSGFRDAFLSYINGKLRKEEIVRACMAYSLVSYISTDFGVFVIDGLYSLCLRYGQPWMSSLPILVCAVVFGWTLFLMRSLN